jgi:Na+/H+ antiporter NhaA
VALFIAELALAGPALDVAKIGILGASAVAAVLGLGLLVAVLPRRSPADGEPATGAD